MSKNLYITTTEARSGKSAIALGVMEMLLRDSENVAFFRPIINAEPFSNKSDNDIQLINGYYHLKTDYQDCYAYTVQEAQELITSGKEEELLDGILAKYKALENKFDFVLCEGSDFESGTSAFEFDINTRIANNLGTPLLVVTNAFHKNVEEIISSVELAIESLDDKGCEIVALIVNRVPDNQTDELNSVFKYHTLFKDRLVYTIPDEASLGRPTMSDIANRLEAEIVYGKDNLIKPTTGSSIAAMQVGNYMERLKHGTIVITPGDRADIIIACILSLFSIAMPKVAGIVLTGGMKPEGKIRELIDGLIDFPISILSVKDNTFETALKINSIHATISLHTPRKIVSALGLFESHVNVEELQQKISITRSTMVTPKMFEYGLLQKAKSNKQHIVLPEGA